VRSIAISVSVCMSVRSHSLFQQPYAHVLLNFLLLVGVAYSSYDDSAICYVLPVLG